MYAEIIESEIQYNVNLGPFDNKKKETSVKIDSKFVKSKTGTFVANNFFILDINKSPTKYKYKQTFNKIDYVASYVGGLAGTIISLFFLLNMFNGKAFLISLSRRIFSYRKNQ